MDIKQLVEKFEADLDIFLDTNEHQNDCVSFSEGQECCLDREREETPGRVGHDGVSRKFIIEWLRKNIIV
jgi:hypothetical protein